MTRDWRADALCAQTDPDLFFPEVGQPAVSAKEICDVCPVRVECLTYALDNGEGIGVWGGLSANERNQLLRRTA